MEQLKLSDYYEKEIDYLKLENDMKEKDRKGEWSLLIDKACDPVDIWRVFYYKDCDEYKDYCNLIQIDVKLPTGTTGFESKDGLVVDDSKRYIFALKDKRKKAIEKCCQNVRALYIRSIMGGKKPHDWDESIIEAVRSHIDLFASIAAKDQMVYRSPYKDAIEGILEQYREYYYDTLFCKLFSKPVYESEGVDKNCIDYLKDVKIVLSDEKKNKAYPTYVIPANEDDRDKKEFYEGFTELLLGVYFPDEHKVVLYIEAMRESGRKGKDFENLFLSVLIHELFHAVHHKHYAETNTSGIKWYDNNNNNEIIIESLAAAFEYWFCNARLDDKQLARAMKAKWERHSVFVYPYSGALQIVSSEDQDEMLIHINSYFHLSVVSMDLAKMELLSHCS